MAENSNPVQPAQRPVYVLGISESHNCTAALLRDGEILAVASEERFSRIKNDIGYPRRAVEFVTDFAGISPADLDLVVLSHQNADPHWGDTSNPEAHDWREQNIDAASRVAALLRKAVYESGRLIWSLGSRGSPMYRVLSFLERHVYEGAYVPLGFALTRAAQHKSLTTEIGVPRERIYSAEHQLCHMLSALYCAPTPAERTVVLTLDRGGDGSCATVTVSDNGKLERIAQSPNAFSLGSLYASTTEILGMLSDQHEYKVMGLAPYADPDGVQRVLPVFEELLGVEGLTFTGPIAARAAGYKLRRALEGKRFDWIAGAVQLHCENLMREFVQNALEATGAHSVVCGGGVFMNVKANMILKDLPGVEHFGVCASSGDESAAIGAAYHGYERLTGKQPRPLDTIYLGPEYNEGEIEQAMERLAVAERSRVEHPDDIDRATVELLVEGEIVARFQGRTEFGARALGNRSILAHPSDPEVVPVINHQIKQRDFWMPFAPTILDESQDRYIVNPKHIPSPHMMIAFETTPEAQSELRAAIHPFDKTVRPQLLREVDNPDYHRLIRIFQERTGIGAVLNTSFNLHGEPIVCSPDDAFETFFNSGLQHLAIGPYLVSKP